MRESFHRICIGSPARFASRGRLQNHILIPITIHGVRIQRSAASRIPFLMFNSFTDFDSSGKVKVKERVFTNSLFTEILPQQQHTIQGPPMRRKVLFRARKHFLFQKDSFLLSAIRPRRYMKRIFFRRNLFFQGISFKFHFFQNREVLEK